MAIFNKNAMAACLMLSLGLVGGRSVAGDEKPEINGVEEEILRQAKVGTDTASLIAYLAKRSQNEEDLAQVEELITQLGSKRFAARERAEKKLIGLGVAAVPYVSGLVGDDDAEVARRATKCLLAIEASADITASPTVVRVLLRRKADGVVEALLRYLPFAGDPAIEEEIWFGLERRASVEKSVLRILRPTMKDRLPERRALAGCLLALHGSDEDREAARKLLQDSSPSVRLRIAQGLLARNDVRGIPTLIALLREGRVSIAWQAEELLRWVAGDQAPEVLVGGGKETAREQCRKAWQKWWETAGGRLKRDAGQRHWRPRLVLGWEKSDEMVPRGTVTLYGSDGAARWQLKNETAVEEVQFLSWDRVLLAEEKNLSRLT